MLRAFLENSMTVLTRTLALSALLMACSGDKNEDTGAMKSFATPDMVMLDENNYDYIGDIQIGTQTVATGVEVSVDWCSLTTDLRGRVVTDPSAIDRVLFIEFSLTPEEVMAKVEANALVQADTVTQWLLLSPESCTANLSDFSILGNIFDPEADLVESDNTWLLSVSNYPDGRFDILMSTFVEPLESETNSSVVVDDDSSTLSFDTDLHSADPLVTSASFDEYSLDWSGVDNDVNGVPFDKLLGNRLLIGKVAADNITDVESIFLRLDDEAEELYYLSDVDGEQQVYGRTAADLMLATDLAGNNFGGFTTDGVWLVGIECLSCTSPAPLLLSVVEVEE